MALKLRQARISYDIAQLRGKLKEIVEEGNALELRRADMQKREEDITAALGEVDEQTSEEDKAAITAMADAWEVDDKALQEEEANNTTRREEIENQISALNTELEEINERAKTPAPQPEERKDEFKMETRKKFFGLNTQERDALFSRNDVKEFVLRVRAFAKEKRAVNGAALLIPTVLLDLLRQTIDDYSKLIGYVNRRSVPGTARMNITGTVPEAVWTEMCAKLNELAISFNQVEVDGYKVGGYIPVCNAVLEDADDVSLASEILTMIGAAIGLALDKAILYGTGTKMPLGIVPRLAQTSEPSTYSDKAPAWVNLSTTNILSISGKTDAALYKAIVLGFGAAKNKYGATRKFWAMNSATHTLLLSNSISINASGAIVAGMNNTMPIIGGDIVELDFIPDNVIIGGWGDLYLLAERAGTQLATSEHYLFVEDQTVFKGTARYDGMPVIAEGFVAMDIAGGTVSSTAVTFAQDTANP